MSNNTVQDRITQDLGAPTEAEAGDTGSSRSDTDEQWCVCWICLSRSPESQERLKKLARVGLARLLVAAGKARIAITLEQQREIYETLLYWDPAGIPNEVDWLIHQYAIRGAHCLAANTDGDLQLAGQIEAGPRWDARWYLDDPWDFEAEQREIERLEILFGKAPEES